MRRQCDHDCIVTIHTNETFAYDRLSKFCDTASTETDTLYRLILYVVAYGGLNFD